MLLGNVNAPGMDIIAQRKRQELFKAGLIPQEQMSDEEQQQLQAQQQQPPQEDPNMLIGRSELIKAENEQTKTKIDVQVKTAQLQLEQQKFQLEVAKLELEHKKLDDKEIQGVINAQQNQEKIDNAQESDMMKMMMEIQKQNKESKDQMLQFFSSQEKAGGGTEIQFDMVFNPETGSIENARN